MIDPGMLREMIALSSFESGRGKQAMRISAYDRSDYVAMQLIKTFFLTVLAELLIVLVIAGYGGEALLDSLVYLEAEKVLPAAVILFLAVLVFFEGLTFVLACIRHRRACRAMSDYVLHLKDMASRQESLTS